MDEVLSSTDENASVIVDTVFAHQKYYNYINVIPTVQIKEENDESK